MHKVNLRHITLSCFQIPSGLNCTPQNAVIPNFYRPPGKQMVLFGPFAGFSPRYLKTGLACRAKDLLLLGVLEDLVGQSLK